ncbi:MAG: alpha/beta fold hydrolase [Burkholderiales bacterium]|nr:alpha/beta fold hydrolase [Burkholderiales bacterium]MDE1926898.1 alpha/beta fold hydrolase [Burkholderiales bacterium]MDE2501723.1 alpha/beta fold hydrolase [Burkholderiales bacterium]
MKSHRVRTPGLQLTEHRLQVPLDHAAPEGERIEIFARAVVAIDKVDAAQPWLVFLQGGPGFEGPRPLGPDAPAWLARALADYRVLLLDQRGMGRSSPLGPDDARATAPQALAERLAHYRADAIVRDAECFRRELGVERWSVLGQSFGGFCALAYLSAFPGALREVYFTGGLPTLERPVDEVYRQTYLATMARTRRHYERYPEDRERVRALVERLSTHDVRLPGGDRLTPARLRQLGLMLGMGTGSERLHYLLELPPTSPAFLHDVERASPWARNPLYAVIHEACYANGMTTAWSAERVLPDAYAADPTLLTGEHVGAWMFDEMAALAPFRDAAQRLAERPWPALYDPAALAANEVPCAAAVYVDDMYVPRADSEATARAVRGLRPWITNEYEHDGLNAGGPKVLDRLIAMARGRI